MIWRGLSLTQPWGLLMALGEKEWETRSWSTPYRGWVALHAARAFPKYARMMLDSEPVREVLRRHAAARKWALVKDAVAFGAIIAVGKLIAVEPTVAVRRVIGPQERAFGDYSDGRWAFQFRDVRYLEQPIVCRGALSLWRVPQEIEDQLPKVA